MSECGVMTDVQMLAEEDKGKKRLQISLKANHPHKPVHGDGTLCASGSALYSDPAKAELMLDGTGSLNQRGGIHVEVFAAMEVTQEAEAAEEIADEVFQTLGFSSIVR